MLHKKITAIALISLAGGCLCTALAATKPTSVTVFTPSAPKKNLTFKATGWRDPAFGDMGWTHNSGWGKFTVAKGKTVTITLVSKTAGAHPGLSVWHRGQDDTASDDYVVDHFYAQNANSYQFGVKDETSGKEVGNIAMRIAAYGYDLDGQKNFGVDADGAKILTPPVGLNGIKDSISGKLVLKFKALKSGTYMFVASGLNPDASVNKTALLTMEATIKVAP